MLLCIKCYRNDKSLEYICARSAPKIFKFRHGAGMQDRSTDYFNICFAPPPPPSFIYALPPPTPSFKYVLPPPSMRTRFVQVQLLGPLLRAAQSQPSVLCSLMWFFHSW